MQQIWLVVAFAWNMNLIMPVLILLSLDKIQKIKEHVTIVSEFTFGQ